MRVKANFSVFGRKLPSGKKVYYYHCYDAKGKRQWAKSTGKTKKIEAVLHCMDLFRSGLLIPEQKVPTFAEFSEGWWDIETCSYLKRRQLQEPAAETTIHSHRGNFKHHIKDYFAKYKLDEITPETIEGWLLHMSEKTGMKENKKAAGKKLNAKTVNLAYVTLKLMMNEAARKKLIKSNPCKEVKELKEVEIKREILTAAEVKKLFAPDWGLVWDNKAVYYANRLAACTGMRLGEIRGLRRENVFDDYIHVGGQFTRFGYKSATKNKQSRNIPITPLVRLELEELLLVNGSGYVFSEDGGETPLPAGKVGRLFDRALNNIGINSEERMKRNLTFHAWRHFLNTLLLMSDVTEKKVQSVTGHLTNKMTDHYTHFDTRKFTEVRNVQSELLAFDEPEKENPVIATETQIAAIE